MKRLFFALTLMLCVASSCFAASASKVCVAVYAMDGYDTPVEDVWYSDTYKLIAKELKLMVFPVQTQTMSGKNLYILQVN